MILDVLLTAGLPRRKCARLMCKSSSPTHVPMSASRPLKDNANVSCRPSVRPSEVRLDGYFCLGRLDQHHQTSVLPSWNIASRYCSACSSGSGTISALSDTVKPRSRHQVGTPIPDTAPESANCRSCTRQESSKLSETTAA